MRKHTWFLIPMGEKIHNVKIFSKSASNYVTFMNNNKKRHNDTNNKSQKHLCFCKPHMSFSFICIPSYNPKGPVIHSNKM